MSEIPHAVDRNARSGERSLRDQFAADHHSHDLAGSLEDLVHAQVPDKTFDGVTNLAENSQR